MILVGCTSYSIVKKQKIAFADAHTYNISDFYVYTFSICERYNNSVDGTQRFLLCPKNFFDVTESDEIRKVEELYLLKHKTSDLVIYMTTISHKYIRNQSGFLNDKALYKDKFYLRDIEYLYVGKYDKASKSIQFEHQKKNKPNMIWHASTPIENGDEINFVSANIATVENNESSEKPLDLNKILAIPFRFYDSGNTLYNTVKEQETVSTFRIKKTSHNKYDVYFISDDTSKLYKFSPRKVVYFTE